ncbi:MAG: LytR/AlgR family response regulator transcription factor [Lachnospiraceae bacterium]
MINIAICDDEMYYLGEIQKRLELLAKRRAVEVHIECYSDGDEFVKDMEEGLTFDLVYLDIEMRFRDGLDTASWIRQNDYHMLIIFISSHDEYIRKLFEAEPFRFLQKPIEENAFDLAFEKAVEKIEKLKNEYFIFHSGKNIMKLRCRDILYLESSGRKIIVHALNHTYEYYEKLDQAEARLQGMRFIRIHKGYLVNMDNIEAFQYERVALIDGTVLNISEKNRPRIRNEFWNYCGGAENES